MEGRRPGRIRNRKHWRRNELYLGTWNVLSLNRAGTLRILLDQIGKYKIGIIAIQQALIQLALVTGTLMTAD
jgi:hypothetical protein